MPEYSAPIRSASRCGEGAVNGTARCDPPSADVIILGPLRAQIMPPELNTWVQTLGGSCGRKDIAYTMRCYIFFNGQSAASRLNV